MFETLRLVYQRRTTFLYCVGVDRQTSSFSFAFAPNVTFPVADFLLAKEVVHSESILIAPHLVVLLLALEKSFYALLHNSWIIHE